MQILSDLHLDFHRDEGAAFIASLDPTNVDVLVIAGDLAEACHKGYGTMLRSICAKYPQVVMVNGNHDVYYSTPDQVEAMRVSFNALIPNLHWLENEVWEHMGHRFLGATLWFRENPMAFWHEHQLADFKLIKGFKPWVYDANSASRRFLDSRMEAGDIVVTHHLPSQQSVDPRYKGSALNAFFVCEMDAEIDRHEPAIWIHGHTHSPCDYLTGSGNATRVVCNPLGYPREDTDFNQSLIIDV